MSFLSKNVIPGYHGKIFGTNAKTDIGLEKIKEAVLSLDGVTDFILNKDIYPIEFTIHTSKIVKVDDVEDKVKEIGFHAIPKGIFQL